MHIKNLTERNKNNQQPLPAASSVASTIENEIRLYIYNNDYREKPVKRNHIPYQINGSVPSYRC